MWMADYDLKMNMKREKDDIFRSWDAFHLAHAECSHNLETNLKRKRARLAHPDLFTFFTSGYIL